MQQDQNRWVNDCEEKKKWGNIWLTRNLSYGDGKGAMLALIHMTEMWKFM